MEKRPTKNVFHDKENLYSHERQYSPRPKGFKGEHPSQTFTGVQPPKPSTSALDDKEELDSPQERKTQHVRPRPMRFAPSKEWINNKILINPSQPLRLRILGALKSCFCGPDIEDIWIDKCGYCLRPCRRMPGGWDWCEECAREGIVIKRP